MYSRWGIKHILVFDPEDKAAYEWNHSNASLEAVGVLRFEGKREIPVTEIWAELDARVKRLDGIA